MESKQPQEFLFYARVSSNGSDQIQSLDNQIERLKKLRNIINPQKNLFKSSQIMSEVKSVSLGMSVKLQDIILDNLGITLVVTSIDRISRHIPDITFIKRNVKAIILANEDGSYKRYDVAESWRFINEKLAVATEEIETIKKRTMTTQKKRKSTDDELLTKCTTRTSNINKILSKYIPPTLLTDVVKFIGMTQRIMEEEDWHNLNTFTLSNFYFDIKCYYPRLERFAHLKRDDVYSFVKEIFETYIDNNNLSNDFASDGVYINDNLLKEFVNSHICLAKKKNVRPEDDYDEYDFVVEGADDEEEEEDDDDEDDDDDDDDDDEYMNTLMKSFKKVLIKKMCKDLDEADKKNLKYILDKKKNKTSETSKKKSSSVELVEYKKPNNSNKKSKRS
jgi:hypothetical protein